jgi:hypothetical protein
MKIEAGKFYRTRDGSKARIYATDGQCGSASEIHGAILLQNGWAIRYWDHLGCHDDDKISLISEWSEPKLRPWTPDEVPLGAWARRGSDDFRGLITGTCQSRAVVGRNVYGLGYLFEEWTHSTDNGKTWLPCGVEDEE